MRNFFESNATPLFAADFDYFRIPRARWELMLTRLKQMGANAVMLTVPWGFHEFKQGTVDLNGATLSRRNVVGLLKLCARFELYCILNLGPYAPDRGVLGDGLPAWLLDGEPLDDRLPAAVPGWFKALSKTLAGYQWPNGPVIALQVRGEPDDDQPPVLDPKLTDVKWPIWLRKHYAGIEDLNLTYGTNYHTVSDVEFPATWAKGATPLEKDARIFLEQMQGDAVSSGYPQQLHNAGWQIPVYASTAETSLDVPPIRAVDLSALAVTAIDWGKKRSKKQAVNNLQRPIRIDRDPADVAQGPVWADMAPIRADGSVRIKFGQLRQTLWERTVPKAVVEGVVIYAAGKDDLLVTSWGNTPLKIETAMDAGVTAYRLYLNGLLEADDSLKVARGKLSGLYQAENDVTQTDLVFLLNHSATPLKGFLLAYLRDLLRAQVEVLQLCAERTERLSQMLTPSGEPESEIAPPQKPGVTSPTLQEARRGLREADAALRKAVSSIGGLEGGFDIMLDKEHEVELQPATAPVNISPEAFEGRARDILVDAGAVCAKMAPQLNAAAKSVQSVVDSTGLTVAQYQDGYALAVDTTQLVRAALLKIIAQLRFEIASERLPLVVWRIHDQILMITESLRWGVLRQ
jgi:hypothetical protein